MSSRQESEGRTYGAPLASPSRALTASLAGEDERLRHEDRAHESGARMKLLLVEDDPYLRRALSRMLASGFAVTDEASLAEGRARLVDQSFAVVLCDRHLLDGDGVTLLAECQRRCPATRRLLMSGSEVAELAALLRDGTVHAFLAKPFTMRDVFAVLPSMSASA